MSVRTIQTDGSETTEITHYDGVESDITGKETIIKLVPDSNGITRTTHVIYDESGNALSSTVVAENPPEEKSNTGTIIAVILVLIIVAVAAYFGYKHHQKKKKSDTYHHSH